MELDIEKTLVVSTAHISLNDNNLLTDSPQSSVACDPFDYGFRVYCNGLVLDGQPNDIDQMKEDGFSNEFINIMILAHKNDCQWVKFDCDGTTYPELPKFNW